MQFEELITPRLILRKLTAEIYNHLHENMDDSELAAFLGLASEAALQREKDKYKQGYTSFNRTLVNFQLIEKETGKVIGDCGYHTWSPPHLRAEIGYGLHSDNYKGKGLMTEALKAVLGYGFSQMDLHRIEAMAAPYNTASLRLLQNMGFTFEGTLRQHYNVNGNMEDSVMYSLLKHEFKK
jgi:[ribosomal protein S5]-alanine N-acetyltransferase